MLFTSRTLLLLCAVALLAACAGGQSALREPTRLDASPLSYSDLKPEGAPLAPRMSISEIRSETRVEHGRGSEALQSWPFTGETETNGHQVSARASISLL